MLLTCISLSSGDGSLAVVDLRNRSFEQRSDCCESELTCLTTAKVCTMCVHVVRVN